MYFLQSIGGAIFVSIGQNVFANKLATDLAKYVPDLDPDVILRSGATSLQQSVPPAQLPLVKRAYNNAITRAFLVATVMAGLTIIGALAVEWKNIKAKKVSDGNKDVIDSENRDTLDSESTLR